MNDAKIPKMHETNEVTEPPTFSIILPTKNRPEILPFSIGSVLSQSYQNWELILVDNSDDDTTTEVRALIDQYNDSRICYIRTGGLILQDNWEEGYKHVHGEYTLLLRDKDGLVDGTLDFLAKIIDTYSHPEMISWKHTPMHPISGYIKKGEACTIESISIAEILQEIYSFNWSSFMWLAPQVSIIRMSLIKKLCSSAPNRLFYGMTADTVIRYRILLCNPKGFYHIHAPLSVELYPFDSVGHSMGRNTKTEASLQPLGFTFEDLFKYVPIKQFSHFNLKYNELLMYDAKHGGEELMKKLKWDNYYKNNDGKDEFKRNVGRFISTASEISKIYIYIDKYWVLCGKFVKLLNNYPKLIRTGVVFVRATLEPISIQKKISMIALTLLSLFREDKTFLPCYSRHARQHIPIQGNICEMPIFVE